MPEEITYKNKKGVFYPDAEFKKLQDKIVQQKQLIESFMMEMRV